MSCCPNCGHTWSTAKRKPTAPTVTKPTEEMTHEELFAHYKATAPLEDVRFYLRCSSSPAVKAGLLALELSILNLTIPRSDVYRQLWKLKAQWATECYWLRVAVPAARIERRRLRAAARLNADAARKAA